jgi:hypothetical protein
MQVGDPLDHLTPVLNGQMASYRPGSLLAAHSCMTMQDHTCWYHAAVHTCRGRRPAPSEADPAPVTALNAPVHSRHALHGSQRQHEDHGSGGQPSPHPSGTQQAPECDGYADGPRAWPRPCSVPDLTGRCCKLRLKYEARVCRAPLRSAHCRMTALALPLLQPLLLGS